jgi:hypothetical protein
LDIDDSAIEGNANWESMKNASDLAAIKMRSRSNEKRLMIDSKVWTDLVFMDQFQSQIINLFRTTSSTWQTDHS